MKRKALFQAQMKTYAHYTMLVCIWQIGIQVLGATVQHNKEFLGCYGAGWQWVYTSIFGSLFTMFHMMSILMQTIMVMKVFYLVPSKLGYFNHKVTPAPASGAKDDSF